MKSLREQIAELEDPAPKDFDPEAHDGYFDNDSDGEDAHSYEGTQEKFDGREHYEEVAPSKLRRPVKPVLGKRYASALVSREDLGAGNEETDAEDDSFAPRGETHEDPFAMGRSSSSSSESEDIHSDHTYSDGRKKLKLGNGFVPQDEDEEIGSDEAFAEVDAELYAEVYQKSKFPGSKTKKDTAGVGSNDGDVGEVSIDIGEENGIEDTDDVEESVSEDESDGGSEPSEDSEDGSSEDVDMMDVGHSEVSSNLSDMTAPAKKGAKQPPVNRDRAALKALLSSDAAAVASSLSAAASADARKGRAVKTQYKTFDRLLDARIRLQKGLTAANSITSEHDFAPHEPAVKAAEEAALTLWNTIASVRHSFAEVLCPMSHSNNGKIRPRPTPVTTSTPLSSMWSSAQSLSSSTILHHRTILNKWSAKVRASNPVAAESRSRLLNETAGQTSATDMIDGYLATEAQRLLAQSTTATNTSTSTSTSNHRNGEDATLTEPGRTPKYDDTAFYESLLRDLITARSTTTTLSTASTFTSTKLHPSGSRGKKVDTRASKGRKVRYTINERLQNFMAAEDDGGGTGWSEAARNEFFGSLMGGTRTFLDEGDPRHDSVDGNGHGDGHGDEHGHVGEEDREIEGLKLFKS